MTLRENNAAGLSHPEFINGRQVWHEGHDLHDLADRIKNGDPAQGWEGDERLTLARFVDPKTGTVTWELWRLDGSTYNLVAKLPGTGDPYSVIPNLVQRDQRKGFDVKAAVDKQNSQVDAGRARRDAEINGARSERLAWALRRDIGHHYGGLRKVIH